MKKLAKSNLRTMLLTFVLAIVPVQQSLTQTDVSIMVVTSKDSRISQLSREEVAELFLGKLKYINDIPVTPIDSIDSALRERFYQAVTEMNSIRVKAYWSRIVFSGQGRPPFEASVAEAYERIKAEQGALTYLSSNQVTPDMKVVFSVP